jgi:hypothetical protein
MSFGQISFGQMSFGQISFGQMSFGQISFGQMVFSQKPFKCSNVENFGIISVLALNPLKLQRSFKYLSDFKLSAEKVLKENSKIILNINACMTIERFLTIDLA